MHVHLLEALLQICGSTSGIPANVGAALSTATKSIDVPAAPATPYSLQAAASIPARQNNLAAKGVNGQFMNNKMYKYTTFVIISCY